MRKHTFYTCCLLLPLCLLAVIVKGQTKSFLTGQKTGNYITPSLLTLGTGTAEISSPMLKYNSQNYTGLGALVPPTTFRYFYDNSLSILNNDAVTVPTKLRAVQDIGLAGLLGAGADVYIQFRNTGNVSLPSGTSSYFKFKEKPAVGGVSVAVGGLLGLAELSNVLGRGYIGAGDFVLSNAVPSFLNQQNYNGDENIGNPAGSEEGTTTKLLLDKYGEWYAAVTPDADYNSIRLTVALPADLRVADVSRSIEVNVYNAFTLTAAPCSTSPAFTDPGSATGITLNLGQLGIPLSELVVNPERAINDDPDDYSSFSSGVSAGVASTVSQTLYFDRKSSDGITFSIALSDALVSLNLLGGGVLFNAYNGETLVSTKTLSSSLLHLNILDLISTGGYRHMNVTVEPGTQFDRIEIKLDGGLIGLGVLGDALRVYNVNLSPLVPTFSNPATNTLTICSGQMASLSATTSSENELLWYTSQSGGVPVITTFDGVFETPELTTNTVYYVSARKCGIESSRVPVNVTVSPQPTIADAGSNQNLCNVTSSSLAANTPSTGVGMWTLISGPGSALISVPSNPSSTITNLSEGTYVFRWTISSGACSQSISDVNVVINPLPAITPASLPDICQQVTELSLPYSNALNVPLIYTLIWDNDAHGQLFTDVIDVAIPPDSINISIPQDAAAATYNGILKVKNSVGCSGSDMPISFTIYPKPVKPNIIIQNLSNY